MWTVKFLRLSLASSIVHLAISTWNELEINRFSKSKFVRFTTFEEGFYRSIVCLCLTTIKIFMKSQFWRKLRKIEWAKRRNLVSHTSCWFTHDSVLFIKILIYLSGCLNIRHVKCGTANNSTQFEGYSGIFWAINTVSSSLRNVRNA